MARTTFFYGADKTGTYAASGLTPSTGNNGYVGSSAQTWLRRTFIDVLEPNLYFYRYGQMEEIKDGYLTHSWARMEKTAGSAFTKTTTGGAGSGKDYLSGSINPAGTNFSVGYTPADTNQKVGVITVNPEQYAIVNTLADMMTEHSVIDIVKQGIKHFANAAARRIDEDTQLVLYNALTDANKLNDPYFVDRGTGTPTNTDTRRYEEARLKDDKIREATMAASDVAAIAAKLKERAATPYDNMGGTFILLVHTFVAHDLQTESTTTANGFVNIFAQTPEQVQRMVKGYVGTVYGMSIMDTPYIQTKKSSTNVSNQVTVYPSYGLAQGGYGVLKYRFNTYFVPASQTSDGDPLAQRTRYGVKFTYASVVLDEDRLQLAYSASTLS